MLYRRAAFWKAGSEARKEVDQYLDKLFAWGSFPSPKLSPNRTWLFTCITAALTNEVRFTVLETVDDELVKIMDLLVVYIL